VWICVWTWVWTHDCRLWRVTQDDCPTPSAHRRLSDAHRSWHQALSEYQDPEGFRHNLNNCIQALRNVTFHLQSEKGSIPGFDSWYKEWQDRMKNDPALKWLNEARITVVHQGDLTANSEAVVRLVSTYFDAADELTRGLPQPREAAIELKLEPADSLSDALDLLTSHDIPERLLRDSYFALERRWVAADLPDRELLEALAHCHGFLLSIVADAHKLVNQSHKVTIQHGDENQVIDLPFGRLPCMISSRDERTVRFAVQDGRMDLGGRSWSINPDPALAERAFRKYKSQPMRFQKYPMTPVDWLPQFAAHAISILKSGEEHGWFIFFFRGRRMVHPRALAARDAMDKRILAQEIAQFAIQNGFDGIIEVGEVWVSKLSHDADNVPIPAGENPNKTEALLLYALDIHGNEKGLQIPFERRRFRRRPVIHEMTEVVKSDYYFFLPLRQAWAAVANAQKDRASRTEK
jgi:hypothetical protein